MRNPIIPPPISLTSEVERLRTSSESAHRYAERCQRESFGIEEQRHLAAERLTGIVGMCAELNRQLSMLEREVLAIADMLRG